MILFDPARHEPLGTQAWDEGRARAAIERIVGDAEARFSETDFWPIHPRDSEGRTTQPVHPLYFGACGVMWALHYLQAIGAARLRRSYAPHVESLLAPIGAWLAGNPRCDLASYLMGETGVLLLRYGLDPDESTARRLERAIEANIDNPTRELLWGSPGTMLAALFLHEHTREERWAECFRRNARRLWSQLVDSPEYGCRYWTQDMYGRRSTYLDAVHGFVATASPIIRGRQLLEAGQWAEWKACIETTIRRTATVQDGIANWRALLYPPANAPAAMLVQFCHGAPGFVVCLGDFPDASLDDLLLAGGEMTWRAGPLRKGANLCHGTAGNGYAFLKLFRRTHDVKWLARARAFAMHAIAQSEADAAQFGQMRYSLWTGDPGVAIYLWDCIRERAGFPSLDVFFA